MPIQQTYERILTKLSRARVRYLVAGGIAMNIHGLERATHDIDLRNIIRKQKDDRA